MTTAVTDEQVRELAATAVPYSLVLLWWDDDRFRDGADAIEAAHQRRMVSLRADGVIAILCPVSSDTLAGYGPSTRRPVSVVSSGSSAARSTDERGVECRFCSGIAHLGEVLGDVGTVVLDLVDRLLPHPEQRPSCRVGPAVFDGTVELSRIDGVKQPDEHCLGRPQLGSDRAGGVGAVEAELDPLVAVHRVERRVVLDETDDQPVAQGDQHIPHVGGVFGGRPPLRCRAHARTLRVSSDHVLDSGAAGGYSCPNFVALYRLPHEPADLALLHQIEVRSVGRSVCIPAAPMSRRRTFLP